jgi:hypothetical protein
MNTIKARFDGKVFIPCEPVEIPVGWQVEIAVPSPPPELTPEQLKEWEELKAEWDAHPPQGTFDEYLRYKRGEL